MVNRSKKVQRHKAFLKLAPVVTSLLLALAAVIGAVAQLVVLLSR